MTPILERQLLLTRRHVLGRAGVGAAALWSLLARDKAPAAPGERETASQATHFPPKAKRVIYLFQSGAPSQMDLFDHKPKLADMRGAELPDSVRRGRGRPRRTRA